MARRPSSPSWPLPMGAPARAGLCPRRLRRIDAYVGRLVGERRIAGAITLLARRGRIAHLACHGRLGPDGAAAMRPDALFRIYSMTKPMVCAAILMLHEACELELRDPVSRFLPAFAGLRVAAPDGAGGTRLEEPSRPITIHDLLTHTGGLGYALGREYGRTGRDSAAFVEEFCRQPLLGHPGERWRYSSSNDILGRVVEVVAGRPLDEALAEMLFAPLGMRDTAFWVPAGKRARLAGLCGHDADDRIVAIDEERPIHERPAFLSGGAGLVSSTADCLRFGLMLLGGGELDGVRLLAPRTVELMRQDHLPPGHPPIEPYGIGYGYGVSVLRSLAEKKGLGSVGEFGWGGAAGTNMWIDPHERTVTMVMLQLRSARLGGLDHRIRTALAQAIVD